MQWQMALIIFGFLWLVTLPAILYFAVYKSGGLEAVWTLLPIFYTMMQILLAATYLTADWESIGKEIHHNAHGEQSSKVPMNKDECEQLLPSNDDDDSVSNE